MTLRELFDNLILLLGVEDANRSPVAMRNEVLLFIRAGLQQIQAAGEDYYGREDISVSIVSGTPSYLLAKEVQNVLEPLSLSGRPLTKLSTRAQYLNFGPLFLDQLSPTAPGTPQAFFVESQKDNTTGEGDSVKLTLFLAPTPDAAATLTVPVIKEPPVYTSANLCDGTIPPIPHKYHESILLPICRWNVSSSFYFSKTDLIPKLRDDWKRALRILGIVDPRETPRKQETTEAAAPQPQAQAS